MTQYYVSPSGNAGNNGLTASTPKPTVASVLALGVGGGDVINLLPGVYTEQVNLTGINGASGNHLIIKAHDSNNRPQFYQIGANKSYHFLMNNCNYITLDGIIVGPPTSPHQPHNFVTFSPSSGPVSNIIIQNSETRWCSVYWGIIALNNTNNTVSYVTVRNNYFHDTTGNAAAYNETVTFAGNCHHILIENNTLERIFAIGIDFIGGGVGAPFYPGKTPSYVIVRNNTIKNVSGADASPGVAIKFDGLGTNAIVEGNYTEHCTGLVTGVEPTLDPDKLPDKQKYIIVRNNVFNSLNSIYTNNKGVEWGMGSNGMDTVVHTYEAKVTHSILAHNVIRGRFAAVGLWRAENTAVINNVIESNASGSFYMSDVLTRDEPLDPSTNYHNTNMFNGNPQIYRYYGSEEAYWNTLATLHVTHPNFDADSFTGAPTYTNTAANNWKLTSTSNGYGLAEPIALATNSGTNSTTLIVDRIYAFSDGYGLITGDTIEINNVEAVITGINYGTSTITLNTGLTWNIGDAVYWGYDTPNPSIGIIEPGSQGIVVNANAGQDQIVIDTDNNGSQTVNLNGTGSTASGSTIESWEWSTTGGVIIPDGATTSAVFPVGDYVVTLLVTDNLGNTDTDTVNISVTQITSDPCDSNQLTNGNFALNNYTGWTTYSNAPVGNSDPCVTNVLTNGNFATNDLTGWTFVSGGASSASAATGAAVMTISGATSSTQLMQTGISVTTGQQYTLKFDAKCASGTNQFETAMIQNSGFFNNVGIGYQTTSLTTTMQTFEYTFIATLTEADTRLRFYFPGTTNGTITIDNVCFGLTSEVSGDTFSASTGKSVATLSGNASTAYLQQTGINITSGGLYGLSFTASGTAGEEVTVTVLIDGGANLGLTETFVLAAGTQTLNYQFVANASSANAKVYFNFVGVIGTVNIDNVCLGQIISGTLAADFSYSPLSPTNVDNVVFTDLSTSTNPISTWTWNFGDGSPGSSLQNPTHNFASIGTYNVSLTVTNGDGNSNTTKQITVSFPEIFNELPNYTGKYIIDKYGNVRETTMSSKLSELFNTMNVAGMVHIVYNVFTGLGLIYEPVNQQYLYFNIDSGDYIIENAAGTTIDSGTSALLATFGTAHAIEMGVVRAESYWNAYQTEQNTLYGVATEALPSVLSDQITKVGTI